MESGYKANTEKEEAKKENIKEETNENNEVDKEEINENNKVDKEETNKDTNKIPTNGGMVQYVADNFIEAKIKYDFITKHYPYQYDPEFWIEMMELPVQERTD